MPPLSLLIHEQLDHYASDELGLARTPGKYTPGSIYTAGSTMF